MKTISEKRVLFHKLLYKLNALELKVDMLEQFNVKSTLDLSEKELDELNKKLMQTINQADPKSELRYWRSVCLALLNKCGVYVDNDDWSHVNHFLKQPRIAGKELRELTVDELKKLQKKLREIAAKKKQNDIMNTVNGYNLN